MFLLHRAKHRDFRALPAVPSLERVFADLLLPKGIHLVYVILARPVTGNRDQKSDHAS
jgi:hypothetical protein